MSQVIWDTKWSGPWSISHAKEAAQGSHFSPGPLSINGQLGLEGLCVVIGMRCATAMLCLMICVSGQQDFSGLLHCMFIGSPECLWRAIPFSQVSYKIYFGSDTIHILYKQLAWKERILFRSSCGQGQNQAGAWRYKHIWSEQKNGGGSNAALKYQ